MKKNLLLVAILAISLHLAAQSAKEDTAMLPAFGSVDIADLKLTACDFDEKAAAMVLLEERVLENTNWGLVLNYRMRVKILDMKGLEWANVHLRYRTGGNQFFRNLEAQTYNLNDSGRIVVTRVEGKQVYEKKVNKKIMEKAFTFPEVRVGSVIEYAYRFYGIGERQHFPLQRSIPVRYSSLVIEQPGSTGLQVIPHTARTLKVTSSNAHGGVARRTYSLSRIPAQREEPFMINEEFYRDRLETRAASVSVTWPYMIEVLMKDEDFGLQLDKNIPRTAELDDSLKPLTSDYARMKAVYRFVQRHMEWNEYPGIWALDGVRSAWKDKKGTAGEINLILVNLLKEAGLQAQPVLVSTHDHGLVDTENAGTYRQPGIFQFNKVLAYVTIGSEVYVLDATQKGMPVHLIPFDVLYTQGLLIDKPGSKQWGWRHLWNEKLVAKNILLINAQMDEAGALQGQASLSSFDYARLQRQELALKGADKFREKMVAESNPGLTMEEVQFENLESDSLPLVQKIKFVQPLQAAGDYRYFSANILSGLEKNPFVADNRFSDVFFGVNQSYTIIGSFGLLPGFEFDELPKDVKIRMPDTSIVVSRRSQVVENRLQTVIHLDIKKPIFRAQQYGELQEFYQRLFEILNEQFVIRKKTAQP